jgi:hypothetical protein
MAINTTNQYNMADPNQMDDFNMIKYHSDLKEADKFVALLEDVDNTLPLTAEIFDEYHNVIGKGTVDINYNVDAIYKDKNGNYVREKINADGTKEKTLINGSFTTTSKTNNNNETTINMNDTLNDNLLESKYDSIGNIKTKQIITSSKTYVNSEIYKNDDAKKSIINHYKNFNNLTENKISNNKINDFDNNINVADSLNFVVNKHMNMAHNKTFIADSNGDGYIYNEKGKELAKKTSDGNIYTSIYDKNGKTISDKYKDSIGNTHVWIKLPNHESIDQVFNDKGNRVSTLIYARNNEAGFYKVPNNSRQASDMIANAKNIMESALTHENNKIAKSSIADKIVGHLTSLGNGAVQGFKIASQNLSLKDTIDKIKEQADIKRNAATFTLPTEYNKKTNKQSRSGI